MNFLDDGHLLLYSSLFIRLLYLFRKIRFLCLLGTLLYINKIQIWYCIFLALKLYIFLYKYIYIYIYIYIIYI